MAEYNDDSAVISGGGRCSDWRPLILLLAAFLLSIYPLPAAHVGEVVSDFPGVEELKWLPEGPEGRALYHRDGLGPGYLSAGAVPGETVGIEPRVARLFFKPLDLNRVDVETLVAVQGVGPKLAERIVLFREEHGPFRAKEELLAVRGIGPAKYAGLQSEVFVGRGP